jgi:hypothetical protein
VASFDVPCSSCRGLLRAEEMTANNTLERACAHRDRVVLAMNCVLAGAEWARCLAAQLSR